MDQSRSYIVFKHSPSIGSVMSMAPWRLRQSSAIQWHPPTSRRLRCIAVAPTQARSWWIVQGRPFALCRPGGVGPVEAQRGGLHGMFVATPLSLFRARLPVPAHCDALCFSCSLLVVPCFMRLSASCDEQCGYPLLSSSALIYGRAASNAQCILRGALVRGGTFSTITGQSDL